VTAAAGEPKETAMEFRLPELGEGVYEAELVAWLVKPGQVVKRGQGLMEVLTDKASMEVPSPFHGTIAELRAEPGQKVKIGEVALTYTSTAQSDGAPEAREERKAAEASRAPARRGELTRSRERTMPSSSASVQAAPSVRHLARKLGVDLTLIHGTGPGGRILIEDLSSQVKPVNGEVKPPAPAAYYGVAGTRVKFQGVRRKIAEHLVHAKHTIPHYTYVDECDVSELVRLRESLRDTFQQAGVKLTYLAFFVKAAAAALKEVPIVNATLDENAGEIVLHEHYHLGVAVSTPQGLMVPVIHDADGKTVADLAQEIERLSAEARAGKIRLEDLRGGTFTVTSVGNIGGLFSTPVINSPEVAILGVGKIVKRPVFDDGGHVRPADILYLSLSFDHRVVDGAIGAAFGNALCRRLRNPAALLLPEHLL
jgi:pyruvate dehydrogenase E2 component (dihydrolipoamide acetyltransferase)/2-oxoisovalerate dehydrogenase E2 component (dihydrolipoyl transacylase)